MSHADPRPDFDRRARLYDDHARVQRSAAAWLAEWLPPRIKGPALELGAGTGIFTKHVATAADLLIATDISPRMVSAGASALPRVQWTVSAADAPPRVAPYHWIFSCSLAQWLADPAHTFRQWHQVAAPEARLLAGWFVRGTLEEFYTSCPEALPFRWRDVTEWLGLLAETGWFVRRHGVQTFLLRHANAAAMLRDMHNLGAVVPGRFGPGSLRQALREHDRRHAGAGGIHTPFVFLRVEATRQ